jgi:regulator of protease activity HflC (stomatin/prohibitin superfamily)
MKAIIVIAIIIVIIFSLSGCLVAPYDVPEFEEIKPSESAFLIPLEGDTSKQVKFESEEALKKMQVSAKRIKIPHKWVATGRLPGTGQYLDTVMLIKVNRRPVTREWTSEENSGTNQKNEAVWAESKDSVGFSIGVTISAMIEADKAALFLYKYPSGALAQIMDTEIRAKVQSVFADEAGKWDMSDLRAKKADIAATIRKDVTEFFKKSGITITTIGFTGGFKYENKEIQNAIDKVFIAQREKDVAKALLDAQKDKNTRITQEAEAQAKKVELVAEAQANGQKKLLEVAKMASQDPVFLQMRKLEVEKARIEKWDGKYPMNMTVLGNSGAIPMLKLPETPR